MAFKTTMKLSERFGRFIFKIIYFYFIYNLSKSEQCLDKGCIPLHLHFLCVCILNSTVVGNLRCIVTFSSQGARGFPRLIIQIT